MAKFKVNDEVYIDGKGKGFIDVIEPGYIGITLSNGVELDLEDESKLMTKVEYDVAQKAKFAVPARKTEPLFVGPNPTINDLRIVEPHPSYKDAKALAAISQTRPEFLDVVSRKTPGFEEADAYNKLRMVAEFYKVPMLVFREAVDMGMIDAVLNRMVFGNLDKVGDMILAKIARVLK